MIDERSLAINPIVPESVQHNIKVLSQLRNLTSSLFGIAAGILGLEAYTGFLFYLVFTSFVSGLVWLVLAKGKPSRYYATGNTDNNTTQVTSTPTGSIEGAGADGDGDGWSGGTWKILSEDVIGGLSSFVLTWTLFYGIVRV